jgi:hypothetical protein
MSFLDVQSVFLLGGNAMAKPGPPNSYERNRVIPLANAKLPKLTPPAILSKPERLLFIEIVSRQPHLVPADAPMVAAYTQALAKAFKLGRATDTASVAAWEKATRVALALARSLRLLPINSIDPQSLGRRRKDRLESSPLDAYFAANPDPEETDDDGEDDNGDAGG